MTGSHGAGCALDERAEAASLCHDLRQYVAAALMLADQRSAPHEQAEVDRRLATIAQVLEDVNGLIEDYSSGQRRAVPVDLAVMVQECVELARLMSTVPIELGTDPGPVHATATPALLRRAVLNVLTNATRAAGVGGRVTVTARRAGEHALIEVTDDGAGFGRIPAVNGYGMSVVEAAVRAAHGRLEIHSGPGPGTCVRLRLPRPRVAGRAS